jgi:hypothetical protein
VIDDLPPRFGGLKLKLSGTARAGGRVILDEVATKRPRHGKLLPGFRAIGRDIQPKAAAHGDDCLDDRLGLGVVIDVADEAAVDLDLVEGWVAARSAYSVAPGFVSVMAGADRRPHSFDVRKRLTGDRPGAAGGIRLAAPPLRALPGCGSWDDGCFNREMSALAG